MDGVKRVEMGVASGYWDRWTMRHALKEIVANARDEGISCRRAGVPFTYDVTFEPGRDGRGTLTVVDTGQGFDKQCLMLGAGQAPLPGQTKQFHEGLKGAALVAARMGRDFRLWTTGFALPRVAIEETQLGPGGFVLYVDERDVMPRGTRISVQCTEAEVRSVLTDFTGLRIAGIEVEQIDDERIIWIPKKGTTGKVYVNGTLATEKGGYLFNYNFQFDKLREIGMEAVAGDLKQAQNRDREHVEIEAIEKAIIEVLSRSADREIVRHFLTAWQNGGSQRREYSLSNRYRSEGIRPHSAVSSIWREIFREAHPGKVCMPPEAKGYGRQFDEHQMAQTLADHGWQVLPDNIPSAVLGSINLFVKSVTEVMNSFDREPEARKCEYVDRRQWTPEEEALIAEVTGATCRTFNVSPDSFPKVRIFIRHYLYPDAPALWANGAIILRRDHVAKAMASHKGFVALCSSMGHEYAHHCGGSDHSTEFEQNLSRLLGIAISNNSGRQDVAPVAVTDLQDSSWVDDTPETLTYGEIIKRFSEHATKGIECYNHDVSVRAPLCEAWGYAGMVTIRFKGKGRDKQVFYFTARDSGKRRTPMLLWFVYHRTRLVKVGYRRGSHATGHLRYDVQQYGELDRSVPFAEHDLAA